MVLSNATSRVVQAVRHNTSQSNLCHCFASLSVQSRSLSSTSSRYAVKPLHAPESKAQSSPSKPSTNALATNDSVQQPAYKDMTPAQRAARAAERARALLQEQQQKYSSARKLGGLADNSLFADKDSTPSSSQDLQSSQDSSRQTGMSQRSLNNMAFALNPRPDARARWQRKMLIRHIRHRGRLSRHVQIARTERSHLSKSYFFKTSMKKLAPLARQIAGKSIDQAILQMRFSKKKAAREVRAHLIQARDEAIVVKGMGLSSVAEDAASSDSAVITDPSITPPLPHQNPTKSTKSGLEQSQTDIYVSEAWVNRGPYGMVPEFRARGRVNILRPPWTGISVVLKEEKTRTRQKVEKETKAIKKRMGKNMWLQLPDRPVTRQSQYVLW